MNNYIYIIYYTLLQGAQNGIRAGVHPMICILCGMFTGTFGGVIRDILCKRDVRILHSNAEIYASTTLLGAGCYIGARSLGFSPLVRVLSGVISAVSLRTYAALYDIELPLAQWNHKYR